MSDPPTPKPECRSEGPTFSWPDFFPDACPPVEADLATGTVLRLVANDPPSPDDFRPWCVENGRLAKTKPCESCSLSVYGLLEDVRRMQKRVPGQRPKAVAQGELNSEMGLTKPTPHKKDSHLSWWIPEGVDPAPAFRVVARPFEPEGA